MNYTIRIIKGDETVAIKRTAEHPPESKLEALKVEFDADYCDVCRN